MNEKPSTRTENFIVKDAKIPATATVNVVVAPPSGPWDVPLREYVKSHILMVSVFDLKTDELIKEVKIDYGNYEDRKFLGKVTFWATNTGYSVETMALKDYEEAKAKKK